MNLSDSRAKPHCGEVQLHDLLGEPRQMHGGDRRGGQRLEREVAIGHRVERIRRGPRKAERARRRLPVDGEGRAGERRRAERTFAQPLGRVGEAAPVARKHLDISEQMMAEGDRLRGLEMGEARHHRARIFERLGRERELERAERAVDRADLVPDIEPEIGRHLVVARARGVQLAGHRPDQLAQAGSRH